MTTTTLNLPDAVAASDALTSWQRGNPALTALLSAGIPAPEALTRLGFRWLKEGRTAEAVPLFRAAVSLEPNDPSLWLNCGAALNQAGSDGDSLACLERSLELNPRQPDTWLLLGVVRKKTGALEAAEAAFRVALAQDPKSPVAWQCLGLLKQERRDSLAAINCFTECCRHGGANAPTLANLGKLYFESGRVPEASDAYARATAWDPDNLHYRTLAARARFLREVLRGDNFTDALAAHQSVLPAADPADLLEHAFGYLNGFGHRAAALCIGERYLELWPESPVMRYLVAALKGEPGIERSPSEYVTGHFDAFAEKFDQQLIGNLGYNLPEKICAALHSVIRPGDRYDILDVGCGTGLCGPGLRPLARRLTGVDLSSKMLDQARSRGIYDELIREDLTQFLQHAERKFDVVIAADVLIYLGDLAALFAAAAQVLPPGGYLVFSTEIADQPGYSLGPSGRFRHYPDYIRCLTAIHFEEVVSRDGAFRQEAHRPVPGNLYVLRRTGN